MKAERSNVEQTVLDLDIEEKEEKPMVVVVETIAELSSTKVDGKVGSDVGDNCPVCRKGKVRDIGGCNTCDSCGAQLKCGL